MNSLRHILQACLLSAALFAAAGCAGSSSGRAGSSSGRSCGAVEDCGASSSFMSADGVEVSDWQMGVSRLYPVPSTPPPAAPAGYAPVYLSHYGRHGSRYVAEPGVYATVHAVLSSARERGVLTPLGETVCRSFEDAYPVFSRREGELTQKGACQHRGIAARMVRNFPGLFDGRVRVEANSTNLERTMLSMLNFTQQLVALRPDLHLHADASRIGMGAINQHSSENPAVTAEDVRWKSQDAPWRPAFREYFRSLVDWRPVCSRLFTDLSFVEGIADPFDFLRSFYIVTLDLPSCPESDADFFRAFTSGELDLLGRMDNYAFYVEKGRYTGGNLRGCYLSESVLGDILDRTSEDLASGVGLRLRFGHDGCIMALLAMLKLDGWDAVLDDPAEAWTVWDVSKIPMASNIQIVLYAPKGRVPCCGTASGKEAAGAAEDELLFMMLLNEEPLTLPLDAVAPHFYRWSDFLAYCGPILDEARTALGQ
ncbi:MAG: hypothetical protein J1D85_07485 [Bacteroidales bacterium]|nr:hypothetical protein [Bacteroidales bacterium]